MSNRAKRRQSQFQPKPRRGPQNPTNNSSSSTDTLVQQMAALLLRHEDQFGGLEPEHLLGSLCGNGPSLERSQHSCSGNPVEQRAEGGSQQNQGPSSSLERLESDPDFKAEAIRLEILSASGDLPYLRWNSQTMRAEVLTDKSPLTVNEVVLMLKELTVLSIADGTITRFHPTRRFSEDMMGPTVTFRLELGLREVKTFRFWQILETLSANSALRLVASSLRRERMTRSRWPRASHQL